MGTKQEPKKWNEMTPQEKKKAKFNLICIGFIAVIFIGIFAIGGATSETEETKPVAIVCNSEWNASVKQVKDYLKENLNDPSSYDPVEWAEVTQHPETKEFIVRHKYRAKNAFGATMTYNQLFTMDSTGIVIGIQNWE